MPTIKLPPYFRFAMHPKANPRNTLLRRWWRIRKMRHHHKKLELCSKAEGGCFKCGATEATHGGQEDDGFVHMFCYYCEQGFGFRLH